MSRLSTVNHTPQTGDVSVLLDGEGARIRDQLFIELQDAIDAEEQAARDQKPGDRRLSQPSSVPSLRRAIDDIEDRLRGHVVTLRFTTLPAAEWRDVTAAHPPRPNVRSDSARGYNVDAVARAAAPHPSTVSVIAYGIDGENDDIEQIEPSEWDSFWPKLSAGDLDRIWVKLVELNEYAGNIGIAFLKKGSAPSQTFDVTSK